MSQLKTAPSESNGLTSTEDQINSQSNSQTFEGEPDNVFEMIENTPFTLVKQEGHYFIAFLSYVLTRPTESREEQLSLLKTQRFEITAMYIMALLDMKEKGTEPEKTSREG